MIEVENEKINSEYLTTALQFIRSIFNKKRAYGKNEMSRLWKKARNPEH